ncbi:phospholipase D nuclease [Coniophora puteana RWD-64-598 SS2]|uniref:Phospholipase D nuclease n=1 Tax=Coniophora puteana (strain RWD-64-598) TaxID=741705 RepID=A0A5M3ME99_CONPW|nr:phospholipase D nuclease [Coniophora puteana RWD-64-598 SS2]EIW76911.1 phospholipase D nuclease [Coniophora puteana RWD-64-598 SS2]
MDSDEDLARAIALSLQDQANKPKAQPEVHVIDDSSDDDEITILDEDPQFSRDLKRAMKQSKAEAETSASTSRNATSPAPPAPQAPGAPSGFISERAKMEQERLARLKRLRGDSVTDTTSADQGDQIPVMKRQRVSPSRAYAGNNRAAHSVSAFASSSSSGVDEAGGKGGGKEKGKEKERDVPTIDRTFWDGELRPTANRHAEPRADGRATFRLSEVIGHKSNIEFAILSSFSTSISWIYEFFDPHTPVIFVAQPDSSGNAALKNVLPNWLMTTPFLRNGYGCQHMKFMLLFYKDGRLRVVISTANLIDYDWRDIENAVWLQDVPRRPSPIPHDPKAKDDFPSIMQNVLRSVNVRPALANMLANDHPNLPLQTIADLRTHWDFSKVKVKLVPSIAGKHEGWPAVVQSGHPRLMKAVRDMGLRTGKGKAAKELVVECQGSSIGTYTTQWLNEFHHSARGESAEDWLDAPRSRRTKLPFPPVKIIFPSLKRVRATALGERGGGTMFCKRAQWEGKNFPRGSFYESESRGGRTLMHTKMIIGTFRSNPLVSVGAGTSKSAPQKKQLEDSETEPEDDDVDPDIQIVNEPIGWAYVGSHNFTPSAWGTLSGSSFNPSLNNINYELGIVMPLYNDEDIDRVSCFKHPPKKYGSDDVPWMQDESLILREIAAASS